jgi:hypothetical protein
VNAVAIQADGKLVVGGFRSRGAADQPRPIDARFLSDGSRDRAFGRDGIARLDDIPSGRPAARRISFVM